MDDDGKVVSLSAHVSRKAALEGAPVEHGAMTLRAWPDMESLASSIGLTAIDGGDWQVVVIDPCDAKLGLVLTPSQADELALHLVRAGHLAREQDRGPDDTNNVGA